MFVKVTNGQPSKFPYTPGQLRRDNPDVSLPKHISDDVMSRFGVYRVQETEPPILNRLTQVAHPWVALVDGVWTQTWSVQPRQDAEISVRAARDAALKLSDWTQVADAPVDKAAWAAYRQALRDLPQTEGWPDVELPHDPDYVSPEGV